MQVRATQAGWYGLKRHREGSEFELAELSHFSHQWMEPLDFKPPKARPGVQPAVKFGKDIPGMVAQRQGERVSRASAPAASESESTGDQPVI